MFDISTIKAAIFDIDGTLLDSMPIWDSVASDYLVTRGKQPKPDLHDALLKIGGHQIDEYFRTEYDITETAAQIHEAIRGLLREFYHNKAQLKEGAVEVLSFFKRRGVRMCAATATERYLIEPALARVGILGFFERIFTCGEEKTSKSSPDIYLRAAVSLGSQVHETVVFEDALYAAVSAKGAGFPLVTVYDRSFKDQQEEIKRLGDYYYASLLTLASCLCDI